MGRRFRLRTAPRKRAGTRSHRFIDCPFNFGGSHELNFYFVFVVQYQ
jgi:hypothetical protein